jgi:dTDP-4-amino-4,6-dideoxygalactose transaminase
MKKMIVFGEPLIEKPEIDEVSATLRSGWLGKGPKVEKFERMFARFKGTKFAAGVNSCTAALHLSLLAIGERSRGEVILPTMTFAGAANAVINSGKKPVLVDCLRDTGNIDPRDLERKLTGRTQAVIPVHLAGRPCEMEPIMALKKKHGFVLVEDCAHAIEAEYKGRKTGTFGEFGCFSFYVTKNITTGEGGMVITNKPEYDRMIKILAMQGMSKDAWGRFSDRGYKHYGLVNHGYKYSMTDIQASMGIHQLPRIRAYWMKRRDIWNLYNKAFRGLPVFVPADCPQNMRHAYNLYQLCLDIDKLTITRDEFLRELFSRGIGSGIHFMALHLHPYYRKAYGYRRGDFPNAEWISARTVSLPLSPKLTREEVARVIQTVADILKTKSRRKYL